MNPLSPILQVGIVALAALSIRTPAPDTSRTFIESRLVSPSDPIAYYERVREGIRLYDTAKYKDAAQLFQRAVAEYPVDGNTWIYLGHALRQSGKPREAITAFQKGLELTSSWQPHYVYFYMAQCCLGAGDKEAAYRALEKMLLDEQYVLKPQLYDEPAFAALRPEARFLKLTGRIDTSKMSRTEGWRTDIDYLVSEVKRVNHLYRKQPFPETFMTRYQNLKRDVPKLSDDEIFAGMGSMLATLHQGHIALIITNETQRIPLRVLPVQFYVFPEGIFIVGSDEKNRDLVGSEVVKMADTPPMEVLKSIEEHASVENRMKILWVGMQPLGAVSVLRGLGVVKPGHDEVRLTLRSRDGKITERTLDAVPSLPPRKLVPPPDVTPPLFVRDVSRSHWFQPLPESDALYVQINQIAPDPNETMPEFGLKVRKFLAENSVKNVILDLRHNNGGDTSTYTEFLRTMISYSTQEKNHLYVIIGRGLYSATANLITDLERLAKPIFVGEPSSGTGNQDGDESYVVLPYSGIRGLFTSVRWQYSHPWDRRTSLVPDVPVQLTAKAYFEGKDPAMETILALIRHGRH